MIVAKKVVQKTVGTAKPVQLTTAQKCEAMGIVAVCERIANCITLQLIADEIGISKGSLIVWLATYPDQYARAREAQADKMAEDIIAIADELEVDAKYDGDDVRLDLSATAVARNRLRVDSRKWLASKMAPKKYGDKLAIGGSDDMPAIKHDVNLSPDEAYMIMVKGK